LIIASAIPLILLLSFLPCSAENADQAARLRLKVELPPVPAYPESGVIPKEHKDRYVFLDREKGELVLSFPPSLNSWYVASGLETDKTRVTDRVPLTILTCPSLNVAIHEAESSRSRGYVYRYHLHNRSEAKMPINKWILPVSGIEAIERWELPGGWFREDWDASKTYEIEVLLDALSHSWDDTYRQQMRRSMLIRRISWYIHFSKNSLKPGRVEGAYGFTTKARPGIVRAYIQGPGRHISREAHWPRAVKDQLWSFDFAENHSLSISTIGPKFPANADKTLIAEDFLDSIRSLIRDGELAERSQFIQETLRFLDTVAQGDGGALDVASWPTEPGIDFEVEILSAIRLSLGR
jgi:hypothetical protein